MPSKFNNPIVSINNELYNYLNDVNYGMTKPQFQHLSTIVNGLINLPGNKSLSRIAEAIMNAGDSSCIYRFLKQSKWDDYLLNKNRMSYLNLHFENYAKSDSVGFLVIDDTINPKKQAKKIEGLNYNHSHAESKVIKSHCVVTSNFVLGGMSIPLQFKPYISKDNCVIHNRQFKDKAEIAMEFISDFQKPSGCEKIYCLVDNWYTNKKLLEHTLLNGFHLIGGIKSNRKISPCGISIRISELEKFIDPNTLDVVTVKGKKYGTYVYEGPVGEFKNALILICYEKERGSFKTPVYLISTDVDLDAMTIINYYLNRWKIEVSYKYLKSNLGFDEYKVRSLISIERYFLLIFLAINFLELFRIRTLLENVTIGDAIKSLILLESQDFVKFIYRRARENISLESILKELQIAS